MALQGRDESTSSSGESWAIFNLQGWQNNCGYTAVHAQTWSGASIEFRRNTSSKESWVAWHKESARSSEEVRGVRGIVQELQNLHESSSQQSSPTLLAKWLISYEDDHITEKPQSDNKTARKSTDPAYMNCSSIQQLRVTSAYNPILSRELD